MATFTLEELKKRHGEDAQAKRIFTAEELGVRGEETEQEIEPVGFLGDTVGDIQEGFLDIGEEFYSAGENIVDTALEEDLTLGEKARGIGAEAFRGGSRAFGEGVLALGKAFLTEQGEEKVAGIMREIGQDIGNTAFVQQLVEDYENLPPDAQREIDNALGFAEGLSEIFSLGAASRLTKPAIRNAVKAVAQAKRASATAAKVTGGATVSAAKSSTKAGVRGVKRGAEALGQTRAAQAAAGTKLGGVAVRGGKQASALIRNTTRNTVKRFNNAQTPGNKVEALEGFADAWEGSFSSKSVLDKLNLFARKRAKRTGEETTHRDFFRDFAEEGYRPSVDGERGSTQLVIDDLRKRKNELGNAMDNVLVTFTQDTSLSTLKNRAKKVLRDSPQIGADFKKSNRELDRFFESFESKYGDTISARTMNEIRKEMNKRSNAFKGELFQQDTSDAVADAIRERLDEVVGEDKLIRRMNAEMGRLGEMESIARLLDNQKVEIPKIAEAAGRYGGTVALTGLITAPLGGGLVSGGLVLAGLMADLGGDAVASMVRNMRFDSPAVRSVIQNIRADSRLAEQLIEEASGRNKRLLANMLLPPATKGGFRTQVIGGRLTTPPPGQKGVPVETFSRQAENAGTKRARQTADIPEDLAPLAKRARKMDEKPFLRQFEEGLQSKNLTTRETAENTLRRIRESGFEDQKDFYQRVKGALDEIPESLKSLEKEAQRFDTAEEFETAILRGDERVIQSAKESGFTIDRGRIESTPLGFPLEKDGAADFRSFFNRVKGRNK